MGRQAHDKIAPGGQRGQAGREHRQLRRKFAARSFLWFCQLARRESGRAAQTNARAPAKWSAFFPDWPTFGVSCTLIFAAAARDPVARRRSSALAATQPPPPPCAIKRRRGGTCIHIIVTLCTEWANFYPPLPGKLCERTEVSGLFKTPQRMH